MHGRMPDIFSAAMGNRMFVALFDNYDKVLEYGRFIFGDELDSIL